MTLAIIQPYFLPYIGYFQLIKAVDKFVVYDDVNFIKRGWINRNNILVNGKAQLFTISLNRASQNRLINEIEIGDDFQNFLRTIEMAYKKAPYFDEVYELLQHIIVYPDRNVANFIANSLQEISCYLQLNTEFLMSSSIEKNNSNHGQVKIMEICQILDADIYINPKGGQELYDKQYFTDHGIQLYFIDSIFYPYKQFKNEFVGGLSMLDILMFNSKESISEMLDKYRLI